MARLFPATFWFIPAFGPQRALLLLLILLLFFGGGWGQTSVHLTQIRFSCDGA